MKMKYMLTFASVAFLFVSCGNGYVKPKDRPAAKAAESEMERLGTLSRQAEKEYYQALESGDEDRIESARIKNEKYCDEANNAIREYYEVLDYERDKDRQ